MKTREISLSTLSEHLNISPDTLTQAIALLATGRLSRALIMDMLTRCAFATEPALRNLIYLEIEALTDTSEVLSVLRQALET